MAGENDMECLNVIAGKTANGEPTDHPLIPMPDGDVIVVDAAYAAKRIMYKLVPDYFWQNLPDKVRAGNITMYSLCYRSWTLFSLTHSGDLLTHVQRAHIGDSEVIAMHPVVMAEIEKRHGARLRFGFSIHPPTSNSITPPSPRAPREEPHDRHGP